jgi:hypothetical protein
VLVFMLMVFCLGALGGVVALAYSPLVQGFFAPPEEEPPAPRDAIDNVPAPDNTVRETPAALGGRGATDTDDPPSVEGLDVPAEDPA